MALALSQTFWYVVFSAFFVEYFGFFKKIPLRLPFWHMNYFWGCCLVFNCLENFLLSLCYWSWVWYHCGGRTHSAWSILLLLVGFVLWYRIWSILTMCSLDTWKYILLWLSGEFCINYILLINAFWVLPYSCWLFVSFINTREKGFKVPNSNCEFVYFFFHFYQFLFNVWYSLVFGAYTFGIAVFLSNWPFIII